LLEQSHFGRTEREGEAVIVAVLGQPAIAGVGQPVAEALDAFEKQGAHGRHVERTGERGADADRPFEGAIVILRHIEAGRGVKLDWRVVEDRGGSEEAALDRSGVEEGLQRRACLTPALQ